MAAPVVKIVNIFANAYDNFLATARTCYSAKGIVETQDVSGPPEIEPSELQKRRERKHALAQSLFRAGHHTTLQHAHVQFALDRVSRHFIWSFLHSHPFYNSEQVSQRYVTVQEDNFHTPPALAGKALEIYTKAVRDQMRAYHELCELLEPLVATEYYARFNGRHGSKRAQSDVRKKSQEIARYVLPVATYAYLYHTISVITLLRYYRVAQEFDTSNEQRAVVRAMVDALLAHEPEFQMILQQPMEIEQTPEYRYFDEHSLCEVDRDNARRVVAEFDREMGDSMSVLVDWGARNEQVLAASVREVLGASAETMPDSDALDLVLNPARNPLLGEAMNLTTLSKLSRTLWHPRYAFRKRLSHAADSQDQRHRLTPGSRPVLMRHFAGESDYFTPDIIRKADGVERRYAQAMADTWGAINELLGMGESPEDAAYLLPNAVNVRFTESADLLNLHHKMAMRLCYNAQEEIWRASLEEALAITRVNPSIGRWLLPPCTLRKCASQKPICPEGDRYCGVPVWRLEREQYQRVI